MKKAKHKKTGLDLLTDQVIFELRSLVYEIESGAYSNEETADDFKREICDCLATIISDVVEFKVGATTLTLVK